MREIWDEFIRYFTADNPLMYDTEEEPEEEESKEDDVRNLKNDLRKSKNTDIA
jgi:hypothetical protein